MHAVTGLLPVVEIFPAGTLSQYPACCAARRLIQYKHRQVMFISMRIFLPLVPETPVADKVFSLTA